MPVAALTPVLNDLLSKDGGSSSSYPSSHSSQQTSTNSSENPVADYLRKSSIIANQVSLASAINDSVQQPLQQQHQQQIMPAMRSHKHLKREDSFLQKFSNRYGYRGLGSMAPSKRNIRLNYEKEEPIKCRIDFIQRIIRSCNYFVLSPDESFLFYWLIVLNIFVLYNLWFSIARHAFDPLQRDYPKIWQIMDYTSDSIYMLDIIIQFRTGYLEQGLLVYNHIKLALNYIRSRRFILDTLSLTPLDLLQIKFGSIPILRFPRFLKVYRTFQLYYLQESRTVYPNTYRVLNLLHILLLLGHWLASFYFMVSKSEGFVGFWSYPKPVGNFSQIARMYLRCLYWSTLTLTTIGDLPPPETNWQWLKDFSNKRYAFLISVHLFAVFVIAIIVVSKFAHMISIVYILRAVFAISSYMVGIFVYSSIIGQVGNVITNRNASRLEFERLLDSAKQYMRSHNVPAEMQRRVQRWYDYSWSRGRMSGAGDVHSIKLLPDKLKTELALHVNLGTLKKVSIFQECQPEFLHDLVLKMRAYIFTPGDIICRKGEVAREMFIIADGVLEVVNEKNDVLTRLGSGDFFGEIGILNIDGANRRTADVRSVGYSELFSLSKEDVLEGCRDYPEAEKKLYEYAQNRLGFERAKKEAAEKMKGAFSTLTSIASCLTHNPLASKIATTTATTTTLATIHETNEKNGMTAIEEDEENEQTPLCSTVSNQNQTKPLTSMSPIQNFNCDKQILPSNQFSLIQSLRTYSNDLIGDIELLINDKLRSVEQSYQQQIADLQEQNNRKDLRIKLLEQKIQKLQKTFMNQNHSWFDDE